MQTQYQIQIADEKGSTTLSELAQFPCKIGRARENQIVLPGWSVGRVHLELVQSGRMIRVIDGGSLGGTWINGRRVADYGPLDACDEITVAGYKLRVIQKHVETVEPGSHQTNEVKPPPSYQGQVLAGAQTTELRKKLHKQLFQALDLRRTDIRSLSDMQLRLELEAILQPMLNQEEPLPVNLNRQLLVEELLSEAMGLGPLDALLKDPSITEIMVNGAEHVFVERQGRIELTGYSFSTDDAVRHIIDRIVSPIGRRIDEASPMVDARLPDGSRVNAVIPPLSLVGPAITIRKFGKRRFTPEDLIAQGSISRSMLSFLQICIEHRKNIVVSGGTGSGKTTLLNVLSSLIPSAERIVTIEDSAELRLDHSNLIALESRPANVEGKGAVSIRDLVKNSLRMRPDRIIVGEVRGGEALDMLQAMNTGHDGSLTTLHSNSARDIFSRLEVMSLMAGIDLPIQALREQISSAVDIVVHQSRFSNGQRKVTSILEVTGLEGGRIQSQEIFHLVNRQRNSNTVAQFRATGIIPTFLESLVDSGIDVDYQMFQEAS
jgi:pilus assembly protein CpaF